MKHKVAELEGALLDAAVAQAQGKRWKILPAENNEPLCCCFDEAPGIGGPGWVGFRPSTDWQHGGPIIEREQIMFAERTVESGGGILAVVSASRTSAAGPTHLIAAMRAYVASKFGEEVELP